MVRGLDCCGCCRGDLGICLKQTWNFLVDRDFQSGSDSLAGLFRLDAHPPGPVPLGPKEMGLLDRVADGEYRNHMPVPERRPVLHADRERAVPDQRDLVAFHMVPAL